MFNKMSISLHVSAFGLSALLAALTSACTLTAPGEAQDNVKRCKNTRECGEPDDNRNAYQCVRGKDQSADTDGVCEPIYANVEVGFSLVTSDPDGDYGALRKKFEELKADAVVARYETPCESGKAGCGPKGDSCSEGKLKEFELGNAGKTSICVGDGDMPIIDYTVFKGRWANGKGPESEGFGFDLRDQFCAWYFCDDKFVADVSGNQSEWVCMKCDPDAAPGEGGCFRLGVAGKKSSIYAGTSDCNDGSSGPESVFLGDVPRF